LPVVQTLDLSAFPATPPRVIDSQVNAAACWHWEKVSGEALASTSVIAGPSIPVAEGQVDKVVDLVKAPGPQMQADRVYLGPEYANYVVSTGNSPSAATVESLWWISESGVRFGVPRQEDTMNALGLKKHSPSPAPWLALRLLAAGPALSRSDALVRHNTLPVDANPAELEVPKS
jgi:hypothetical protein